MLKAVLKVKAVPIVAALIFVFLVIHGLYSRELIPGRVSLNGATVPKSVTIPSDAVPCRYLPATNDIAVILRTGATEIEDKLPAHFNSTFKCYNDLVIFSDYAENFHGYPVHDVLESVDPGVKERNADFEIYLRLQRDGRESLEPHELSGSASFEGSKSGKTDNPGWRLDKWKFLPMMRETLKIRPDKKWYVFLESDSYVVWSNLLQWVQQLDASKPWYFGSENQIGDDVYAHGGSVFVMSRPAVQKAADIYTKKEDEWYERTDRHWAGDCILGIALREAGIPLTWSWPMFQGGHPEKMDFTEKKDPNKRLWCAPALSYHHFAPKELKRMWHFEQEWIRSRFQLASEQKRSPWQDDKKDVLHHRDVFRKFILPNITTEWREWNNLSPDLIVQNDNFDACYHLCEDSVECVQFSVGPPGCSISTKSVMLGQRWKDFRSYWSPDRVDKWMKNMDNCNGFDGWLITS